MEVSIWITTLIMLCLSLWQTVNTQMQCRINATFYQGVHCKHCSGTEEKNIKIQNNMYGKIGQNEKGYT